ncbi:MAG: DUF2956 domain-containing protein [Pseudomonadota bacterium]|nr:DUF2956 domain-containing protein [Pseudomonadota bacterium]
MTQPAPTSSTAAKASSSPKTKQKKDARDVRAEALKIANTIKTEGQTPVETKAIATGIQRGMEMFLRQQSEKTRELDKRVKKAKQLSNQLTQQKPADEADNTHTQKNSRLPWVLLALSWGLFLVVGVLVIAKG